MRDESEIDKKVKEICLKELRKRKKKYLSKVHLNCMSNSRHRIHDNGKVGFCHNPDVRLKARGFQYVCDTIEISENCPHFENKHTVESVEKDFYNIIKDQSKCGQEYPQIHSLLWLLSEEKL